MGPPLDTAVANIFMCNFKNKWLKTAVGLSYLYSVDDTFLNHAEKSKECLSSKHLNIKKQSFTFIRHVYYCRKGKFAMDVYLKRPSVA